jgi:hypothetical protein
MDESKPGEHVQGVVPRRRFLRWLGAGAGTSLLGLDWACTFLEPTADGNPLARRVGREWEKIYHDQYRYDSTFDWSAPQRHARVPHSRLRATASSSDR